MNAYKAELTRIDMSVWNSDRRTSDVLTACHDYSDLSILL